MRTEIHGPDSDAGSALGPQFGLNRRSKIAVCPEAARVLSAQPAKVLCPRPAAVLGPQPSYRILVSFRYGSSSSPAPRWRIRKKTSRAFVAADVAKCVHRNARMAAQNAWPRVRLLRTQSPENQNHSRSRHAAQRQNRLRSPRQSRARMSCM